MSEAFTKNLRARLLSLLPTQDMARICLRAQNFPGAGNIHPNWDTPRQLELDDLEHGLWKEIVGSVSTSAEGLVCQLEVQFLTFGSDFVKGTEAYMQQMTHPENQLMVNMIAGAKRLAGAP